jgi:hypothetical protein
VAKADIRWAEVDAFSRLPGVEFHHEGEPYTAVALLVGFNWLRDPKAPVRAELIKPRGRKPGEPPAVWEKIVADVKEAVAYHVSTKGAGKKSGGAVSVREVN